MRVERKKAEEEEDVCFFHLYTQKHTRDYKRNCFFCSLFCVKASWLFLYLLFYFWLLAFGFNVYRKIRIRMVSV